MTGFGSAKGKSGGLDILVEIRSVNHRFFTLKQSLPEGLARSEGEIEKLVRSKVERGSLTMSVSIKALHPTPPALPDPKTVKEVVRRLEVLRKSAGVKGEVDLPTLLSLPHLWNSADEENFEESWPAVRDLVAKAVDDLARMRRREGENIRKDVEARLSLIEKLVERVRERGPAVLEAYQRKLEDRVSTLLAQRGVELTKVDLLKEIAVYADRCDVSEELQRLASHVEQFRRILRSEGAVGRRLDFLTQEMSRETNTLTAKSNDSAVSIHAVEIKAELEKIKEQSENME